MVVLLISFFISSCKTNSAPLFDGDIIRVDAYWDYPTIDLNLSDLVDISYIPLKPGDDNVMFGYHNVTRNIFVYQDQIFIADRNRVMPKIIVYNRSGDPVKIIGSTGRGPAEYIYISGMDIDTVAKEIFIWDKGSYRLIVYDMEGKLIREKEIEDSNSFCDFVLINSENVLIYNNRSKYIVKEETEFSRLSLRYDERRQIEYKTIRVFDSKTFSEVETPHFEYKNPRTFEIMPFYHYLSTAKEGIFFTNTCSDTLYLIDGSLVIHPEFIDATDYKSVEARLFPAAETERYFFLNVELPSNGFPSNYLKKMEADARKTVANYFVYDKKLKKIFRINNGLPQLGYHDYRPALMKNKPAFNLRTLTQNHNYAADLLSAEYLIDHYNELPAELKAIAKGMKIDDNPVLMLMKFK